MFKDDFYVIFKVERQYKVEVEFCVKVNCVVVVGFKIVEVYCYYFCYCEKD